MSLLTNFIKRLKGHLDSINDFSGNVSISANAKIVGSKLQGEIFVGEHVKIYKSEFSGKISIGSFTSIWGPNTDIHAKVFEVNIGSFCSIARNVTIQEYNHNYKGITTYYIHKNVFHDFPEKDIYSNGPILIGNDVWVGAHCVILSGSKIGNGVIIAANSVVNGEVPPYAIVGGSPAKVIKYRFDPEVIDALQQIQWWLWPIEKIKANRVLFESKVSMETLKNLR